TAGRMLRTVWLEVTGLRVQPTLDGRPAGVPVGAKVVWDNERLLVQGTIEAAFDSVVDELLRHLVTPAAKAVVRTCLGRDPAWIEAYAAAHFTLGAVQIDDNAKAPEPSTETVGGAGALAFGAGPNGPAVSTSPVTGPSAPPVRAPVSSDPSSAKAPTGI